MCWHWPGELRAATVPTRDRGGDGLQPLEHAEPGSAGQGRGPIHSCNLQAALANSCGFPPILSAWGKAQGRLTGQRRAIGGDSRVLWKCFRDVSFGGGGPSSADPMSPTPQRGLLRRAPQGAPIPTVHYLRGVHLSWPRCPPFPCFYQRRSPCSGQGVRSPLAALRCVV